MTNFIRTDQEHKRCPGNGSLMKTQRDTLSKQTFVVSESPDEKIAKCDDDDHCIKNRDFLKV